MVAAVLEHEGDELSGPNALRQVHGAEWVFEVFDQQRRLKETARWRVQAVG